MQPYLLPPLGRHYREVWAEEDRAISAQSSRADSPLSRREESSSHDAEKSGSSSTEPRARYLRPNEQISEDYLLTEDLSCGSLTERLLSSLVIEDIVDKDEVKALIAEDDDGGGDSEGMDVDTENSAHQEGRTIVELSYEAPEEVVDFEERLKRELRYAGLFGDDDVRKPSSSRGSLQK